MSTEIVILGKIFIFDSFVGSFNWLENKWEGKFCTEIPKRKDNLARQKTLLNLFSRVWANFDISQCGGAYLRSAQALRYFYNVGRGLCFVKSWYLWPNLVKRELHTSPQDKSRFCDKVLPSSGSFEIAAHAHLSIKEKIRYKHMYMRRLLTM